MMPVLFIRSTVAPTRFPIRQPRNDQRLLPGADMVSGCHQERCALAVAIGLQ